MVNSLNVFWHWQTSMNLDFLFWLSKYWIIFSSFCLSSLGYKNLAIIEVHLIKTISEKWLWLTVFCRISLEIFIIMAQFIFAQNQSISTLNLWIWRSPFKKKFNSIFLLVCFKNKLISLKGMVGWWAWAWKLTGIIADGCANWYDGH